jgi:Zn-dependent membrane protease YugP
MDACSEEDSNMFFRDPTFFLIIPALILAFYAQAKVKGAYKTYSRIFASSRLTGSQVAHQILQAAGAGEVNIEKQPGELTDHYDPRKKVLRLSQGVHDSPSIAALGIAAHEAGHALQHHDHYQPMALRSLIYPVASLGSTLAFPLFFAGFLFSKNGPSVLMDIGILLFTGAVAFSVVTLPVEFNASKRALTLLEERRFLTPDEMAGARKVLSAAALTYVASTAMAAVQLLRMFLLRSSRD